jgi:hypothetical protein
MTVFTGINVRDPIIYYNSPISGTSWSGSGTTTPHDVFLHLGASGWTLDNLKNLFISGVTDCFDSNISLSEINFLLYKDGLKLSGITEYGIYDIFISFTDTAGNNVTNEILNIITNDSPPIIVYKSNIISNLTGNTTDYSGMTPNIYIESGFTFNLIDFYGETISKIDIINNVILYIYDFTDNNINKYMLNVSIFENSGEIDYITQIGKYCIKFSIFNSSGNEVINYFIMKVLT